MTDVNKGKDGEDRKVSSPGTTEAPEGTTPEEEEEDEEEESPEEEDEQKGTEQDIDFEKELEALEGTVVETPGADTPEPPKSGKTEEEKAAYTVRETINRLKKKGLTDEQISKAVGLTIVTEAGDPAPKQGQEEDRKFVTRDELELREAEREAGRLARSAAEKKVIMWYVKHKRLSVPDAHLLANKGRIRRTQDEIDRGGQKTATVTAGRKEPQDTKPKFNRAEMADFERRGMKWNPQTKRVEGKKIWVGHDKDGNRISGRMGK